MVDEVPELDRELRECECGFIRKPAAFERRVCVSLGVRSGAGVLEPEAGERGESSRPAGRRDRSAVKTLGRSRTPPSREP